MKWYKPIASAKAEIAAPIERIGYVAMAALGIALLALFIALEK